MIHTRKVKAIWLSDIHLGTKGCQADFLVDFLKHHTCEKLFLVGDIIDGWKLRKGIYWPQSHTNVIRRFLTLSKRGTDIYFVTGNHDEFLRKYSKTSFGNIHLVDEAEHITKHGDKIWVTHGDEYDVVIRYQKWLAFLGDAAYTILLAFNRWLNKYQQKLGFDYWSLSSYIKHRVKQAVNFIGDYENALAHACKQRNYDGVICGHIHHAEIKTIGEIQYYNCGDWVESCTALIENETGEIELVRWTQQLSSINRKKVVAL